MNRNVCNPYAECNNTIGSFECRCLSGYTGDGFNCAGQLSHKCSQPDNTFQKQKCRIPMNERECVYD